MKLNANNRNEWIETFVGGTFGVIAIVAAIIEYLSGDAGALAGCIKDIAGTFVVVVILFAAVKLKPRNISGKLEAAVEAWGKANAPLIFKIEEYVMAQDSLYSQGFSLLQDPKSYVELANKNLREGSDEWHKYAVYGGGNHLTGKFIDMPSYDKMTQNNFTVLITMTQSHFKNIPEIDNVIGQIETAANSHCKDTIFAERVGKSQIIKLSCEKIETKSDIETFVNEIDFVLSLVKVIV